MPRGDGSGHTCNKHHDLEEIKSLGSVFPHMLSFSRKKLWELRPSSVSSFDRFCRNVCFIRYT